MEEVQKIEAEIDKLKTAEVSSLVICHILTTP
jgi:hypothetical protein